MKSAKEQLLRDHDIQPSSDVVAKALGEANSAYLKFLNELESRDVHLEWRYYTDGKAWLGKGLYKWTGARGGKKETTVLWLSIWDGFFKVTVYIPQKARADLLNLPLVDEFKLMIEESKQMGKLNFFNLAFELRSEEMFEAIFALVDFKKSIK